MITTQIVAVRETELLILLPKVHEQLFLEFLLIYSEVFSIFGAKTLKSLLFPHSSALCCTDRAHECAWLSVQVGDEIFYMNERPQHLL